MGDLDKERTLSLNRSTDALSVVVLEHHMLVQLAGKGIPHLPIATGHHLP